MPKYLAFTPEKMMLKMEVGSIQILSHVILNLFQDLLQVTFKKLNETK